MKAIRGAKRILSKRVTVSPAISFFLCYVMLSTELHLIMNHFLIEAIKYCAPSTYTQYNM